MKSIPRSAHVVVFCLLLLASTMRVTYGQTSFKLSVKNPSSFHRSNAPVASGILVPAYLGLLNPGVLLSLRDSRGNQVPVQFKVLSRWGARRGDWTAPCKWMLVEFNANVAANSTSTYFLHFGTRTQGQVWHMQQADRLTIGTGAAEFTIDKQDFTLFHQVRVGGQEVTASPGELVVFDNNGTKAHVRMGDTVLEEIGSVRTVVRQRGSLLPLGLDFTVRYYFWSGHSDVKVDFTLENAGAYGHLQFMGTAATKYFQSLSLLMNIRGGSGDVARTSGHTGSLGANYSVEQTWSTPSTIYNQDQGFSYFETVAGQVVNTGGTFDGGVALNGSGGSVSLAVDRFWQNFPKGLVAHGNHLGVDLWPSFGNGPLYGGQYWSPSSGAPTIDPIAHNFYRFEGGRWKTHSINFDFRSSGSFSPREIGRQVESTNTPLMAMAPISHPFKAGGFGQPIIERRDWTQTSHNRFEQLMDIFVDDNAADMVPFIGKIGFPEFKRRGGTFGGNQFWGWENFGDIPWGPGYSSLHYDLPFGVLINWYRTGDYRFYDLARDMVAHRRDYDQDHSTDLSDLQRGGQFYEKGWFHGNFTYPNTTHTWLQGLLLWYVTTGDEAAYEAALQGGEFLYRKDASSWNGSWGARILGWPLEEMVTLWNYTGDPFYLQHAADIAQQWLDLENSEGQMGYVPNYAGELNEAQTWQIGIVFNALAKFHYATQDTSILPCMQRMANWLSTQGMCVSSSGPSTNRVLGRVWTYANNNWSGTPSVHHNWTISESLSHAAIIFNDMSYLNMAEDIWDVATKFHQLNPDVFTPVDTTDPSNLSLISFKMLMYPNSESKIMSNIAFWGHAFPAIRAIMHGYW